MVFEDSSAGIMAAHNGNMKAVGVGNGSVKAYADYFIERFIDADPAIVARKVLGE